MRLALHQVRQGERDHLRGLAQVFEHQLLIGAVTVGLQQGVRTGAVQHGRDALFGIEAGIGIDGHAVGRNVLAHDLTRMALDRGHQFVLARNGDEGAGKQHAAHAQADAGQGGAALLQPLRQVAFHDFG